MISELRNAFAFLTILPIGYDEDVLPGRSFAFYPVVGLVIGLILVVTVLTAQQWFTPEIRTFFALVVWVILTGGLHLDGFGDSCDGLFAAVEADRRLEIMKDSRAGSWAVVGLALLLLGKWMALQHAKPMLLILPPVVGRWAMVIAVYVFPYARTTGIGAYFRTGFGRWQVIIASVVTTVIVIGAGIATDLRVILTVPAAVLIVWGGGRWAASRLGGGLTGDVYGALCELVELVTLFMLTIL